MEMENLYTANCVNIRGMNLHQRTAKQERMRVSRKHASCTRHENNCPIRAMSRAAWIEREREREREPYRSRKFKFDTSNDYRDRNQRNASLSRKSNGIRKIPNDDLKLYR